MMSRMTIFVDTVHKLHRDVAALTVLSRNVAMWARRETSSLSLLGEGQGKHQQRSISFPFFKKKTETEEQSKQPKGEVYFGPEDEDIPSLAPVFVAEIETEHELTEEDIMAKRNKSRLRPWHYKQYHGDYPDDKPYVWYHETVKYKRRMYALYGDKTKINPGIMWPTHEDLAERLEYESVAHPYTIHEMVDRLNERKKKEQEYRDKRIKEVEENMQKLEQYKKALRDKIAAKEKEATAAHEQREKLVEEVRRHFGFTVDPKDERFQEMLLKKEKEQKKAMKERRKAEREAKILAQLKEDSKSRKLEPLAASPQSKKKDEDSDDEDD